MGRHRRSDAGRAATGRATGGTQTQGSLAEDPGPYYSYRGERAPLGTAPYLNAEAYAASDAHSTAYPYATEPPAFAGADGFPAPARPPRDLRTRSFPDLPTQGMPAQGFPDLPTRGFADFPTQGFPAHDLLGEDFSAPDFSVHDFSAPDLPVQDLSRGARDGASRVSRADDDDFWPEGGTAGRQSGRRRKKKAATPVRTGLLGVSAAVAIGTVAVATGVVPGLDNYRLGGGNSTGGSDRVQAEGVPTNSATEQGGTSGSAEPGTVDGSAPAAGRDTSAPAAPRPSAPISSAPAETPSDTATTTAPSKKPEPTPSRTASKTPAQTAAPVTVSAESAAEAEVLRLVNEERAKVGCSALTVSDSLTSLAEAFSKDMAARDFFDHTDPDGDTPWDRASQAGISGLGGENIARGQADAAAVMDAWMNSPGHRANILNCDFKTLGVGVHYASGGPWWTQDFGY